MNIDDSWIESAWTEITRKIDRTKDRLQDTFPHVSINGVYDDNALDWWTNGFWPGILWLLYRENKKPVYRDLAVSCEKKLEAPLYEFELLHHDIGFMWIPTSVANYKITGNPLSLRHALTAASHLAGRFNLQGRFIRAWNGDNAIGWAIIDCLMNLPILFWASETTADPRFRHIAIAHADTVMREFIQQDGSVHHIVSFNPETGERIEALGGQGYSATSAWSRGAAWAIYGFALAYKYTGKERYLQASKKIADFYLGQLPQDMVPPWDFRAPADQLWAKDTSAAACAASGLLEMARLDADGQHYHDSAIKTLQSLYLNYGSWNEDEEGLIKESTVSFPENRHVSVPVIYGDFFFIEAILKVKGQTNFFW